MKKIQGTHIHVGTLSQDGKFSAFAFARQAGVSMSREMIEIASENTGDCKEYIPGRKSWEMNCGCLLSSDESSVINAYNAGTKINISWRDETPDWSEELKYAYTGYAYIESLRQQANIQSMASFNVRMQGTGPLDYSQWYGGVTNVYITQLTYPSQILSQFRVSTNNEIPCDIVLSFKKGKVDEKAILFRKGENINALITVSKMMYSFEEWSIDKAVANYTFNLVQS